MQLTMLGLSGRQPQAGQNQLSLKVTLCSGSALRPPLPSCWQHWHSLSLVAPVFLSTYIIKVVGIVMISGVAICEAN